MIAKYLSDVVMFQIVPFSVASLVPWSVPPVAVPLASANGVADVRICQSFSPVFILIVMDVILAGSAVVLKMN